MIGEEADIEGLAHAVALGPHIGTRDAKDEPGLTRSDTPPKVTPFDTPPKVTPWFDATALPSSYDG